MNVWSQETYTRAWNFASRVHKKQKVPGNGFPYLNHIGNVTMEAMTAIVHDGSVKRPDLLVQCALLHDVIEDTEVTYEELFTEFGSAVADGVLSLSKKQGLPSKAKQMMDSIERIKKQPREVWMVKMSDRISNLQPPPEKWSREKIIKYGDEAKIILEELGGASDYLAGRLAEKIAEYGRYL